MVDTEKKALRKTIRELKLQYPNEEKKSKSETILKKVEQLDDFLQSKIVMAYWSMPDEVHTHDFILKWYNKKTIILPVVKDDELELRVLPVLKICLRENLLILVSLQENLILIFNRLI